MFRESDFTEQKLHASYSTKPRPKFQEQAQAAKFDESGLSSLAFKNHVGETFPIIPTTWDTHYDPTNPDSDWTGLVSNDFNHRRHTTSHVSQQIGLTHTEHGIVSKIEKQEWAHKRQQTNNTNSNKSTLVLGGIHEQNDQWKTTYNSFETKENTNRDQLTLEKRVRPMKLISDPAQARSTMRGQSPGYATKRSAEPESSSSSLVGYRAPSFSKNSMLSSLGSLIAERVEEPVVSKHNNTASNQPRAPDSLLGMNYNPNPGYTGHRTGRN